MSDCTIIKKLKRNDEKAIEELIDKYGRYIAAIIYAIGNAAVGNAALKAEDIEEITSDVFYAIWKTRHMIIETNSLKPYLAQTARNMTRNRLRKMKIELPLDEEILPFDDDKIDERLIQKEKIRIIKEFLDHMKHPDQDILNAYYFQNCKLEDIAAAYKLPLSTVKSKIYRGKKTISEYFKERGFIHEK